MMGGGSMCDLLPIPPMVIICVGCIGIASNEPPLSFAEEEIYLVYSLEAKFPVCVY
jgi:hypothetical protein